ncbi:MAG: ribokinase [Planctomycetes bacterium]|nr:ribokinase [Planctomycetota bacterium]MCH9724610.1 ribokinase [Planctomycetota bacterium]MCH9777899.1 ribokinase [Planctomycetota bacterium]MCH9792279.1 ribokinase [Planctomycetota bacterium]
MNKTQSPKITVLGSINMDLMIRTENLPLPGETVIALSKVENPGGKGANQAVAAARMGAEVTMVGCVGDDSFADLLMQNLQDEQVDTSHVVRRDKVASGVAVVMVEASGENAILVVPGANGLVSLSEMEQAKQTIRESDVLLMQLEVPQEIVIAATNVAREAGVPVILDPAPVPVNISENVQRELLHVDLICPNQSEAAALLGKPVDTIDDAIALVGELTLHGSKQAIITLAEQGAVLFDGERVQTIPAFAVDVVDSTAAGDAFAAGLAVRLAEKADLIDAVRFASAAGALAASGNGAQSAMPSREQIETLLEQQNQERPNERI